VQAGFEKILKAAGGTSAGSLVPLGTPDYSSYLIQAKAYGPQVLINVMGGGDQVASLKQFVQFGLDKQMAVGGALFELESIRAEMQSPEVVSDGLRLHNCYQRLQSAESAVQALYTRWAELEAKQG